MAPNLLDLYDASSAWTTERIAGAGNDLSRPTPCSEWDLHTLLDHMLETQRYFLATGRGQEADPPGPNPSRIVGADAASDFEDVRQSIIEAYGQEGVIDKTGPALGIAFADMLLHGWDVARATGQDATMPDGLADAAYGLIHGQFTDEQRVGTFAPEIDVPDDAPAQHRLLAYTGRQPN
jgi:uncharacterized protein (TIGR03086 family)